MTKSIILDHHNLILTGLKAVLEPACSMEAAVAAEKLFLNYSQDNFCYLIMALASEKYVAKAECFHNKPPAMGVVQQKAYSTKKLYQVIQCE